MRNKLTVSHQRCVDRKLVHVEAPGCIINIYVDRVDSEGRSVTAVEVIGDVGWRFEGMRDATRKTTVRLIGTKVVTT